MEKLFAEGEGGRKITVTTLQSPDDTTIGGRLLIAIKELGLKNVPELSRLSHVPESTLYAIAKNRMKPGSSILQKISNAAVQGRRINTRYIVSSSQPVVIEETINPSDYKTGMNAFREDQAQYGRKGDEQRGPTNIIKAILDLPEADQRIILRTLKAYLEGKET